MYQTVVWFKATTGPVCSDRACCFVLPYRPREMNLFRLHLDQAVATVGVGEGVGGIVAPTSAVGAAVGAVVDSVVGAAAGADVGSVVGAVAGTAGGSVAGAAGGVAVGAASAGSAGADGVRASAAVCGPCCSATLSSFSRATVSAWSVATGRSV